VPVDSSEIAINTSNARFWEPPVNRYVSECQAGKSGERARDFNLRWIASTVAEVHHILMRGGVFMYPKDTKDAGKPSRLRQIYEANPISLLIEQAGGRASTGRRRLLEIEPRACISEFRSSSGPATRSSVSSAITPSSTAAPTGPIPRRCSTSARCSVRIAQLIRIIKPCLRGIQSSLSPGPPAPAPPR